MNKPIKPLFNTPINWGHPLAQGLVASYLMNEGCGDLVHDSCGMNDGKMIGMAPFSATSGWGPGPQGAALAFDGTNDYVNCGNKSTLNITGSITIVTWAQNTPTAVGAPLLTKSGAYTLYKATAVDRVDLYIITASGTSQTGLWSKAVSLSNYCIIGTYDRVALSNRLKLYVNGQLLAAKDGFAEDIISVAANVFIGTQALTYISGLISSVSIYNRALSAEEIAYLYVFPWCMHDRATPAWMQKDYGREARLANYYQQMRAA